MVSSSPPSDVYRIPADRRDEILETVRARLTADDGGPLGSDAAMTQQVLTQTRNVLVEIGAVEPSRAGRDAGQDVSAEIGAARAAQDVHPSHSLRAAAVLFEAALPVVAEVWSRSGVEDAHGRAARMLHRATVGRIADGAVGYVNTLLLRLQTSHTDERQRVSRELHDRVGHAIAVAMQQLDLLAYAEGRESVARPARDALADAIDEVRRLSGELRRVVDADGLEKAVTRLVEDAVPEWMPCRLDVTGPVDDFPAPLAEEIYLTVREAVRNAVAHAGGGSLRVALAVGATHVDAVVTDTGCGFSPRDPGGDGTGLRAMQDRIDLVGGTIAVASAPGRGTTVRLRVPLPRAAR